MSAEELLINRPYSKTICAGLLSMNVSNFRLPRKSSSCRVGNIIQMLALFDLSKIVDNEQSCGVPKNQVQVPRNICMHLIENLLKLSINYEC
ncbi:hypothetical protein Y032_0015g2650 [Ancylostoma ceylanicum]|uniref:Uncharacterized protein n=1 Tax=Ancylostoma ceylanicum TaxID=53326 RepID=A0A016V838_9BILA|nr:hypothetical protein Y032_0015g2650 [Ancylostoma ceylanicum]